MILVIGTSAVPADTMDKVRDAMKTMVTETLKEEGCVTYNLCEDIHQAGVIRISEEWETNEHLDAHMETAHMKDWRAVLAEVGVLSRAVNVYDGALLRSL